MFTRSEYLQTLSEVNPVASPKAAREAESERKRERDAAAASGIDLQNAQRVDHVILPNRVRDLFVAEARLHYAQLYTNAIIPSRIGSAIRFFVHRPRKHNPLSDMIIK